MVTTGPESGTTRQRVRRVFAEQEEPHAPLSASDVAAAVDCSEEVTRETLESMSAEGELRARQVDGGVRVWWAAAEQGAEESVDSSERRPETKEFGAFVSAVEDYAIFVLDPDGVVSNWNEGAERIKGYSAEEIVGEHFSTFYTEEDVAAGVPERNLETAVSEGRVEDEGWRVRRDGSRFWADVTITAIRNDDGTLRGFTKVTRDMTERREYEQRLREERDFTERVLETVPVSVFVADADGEILRANERALERLGIDDSDTESFDVSSWTIYDDEGEPISLDDWPWTRVLETGEPIRDFEYQVDFPDLGRRWLSLDAAPLDEGQSDEERVVFSIEDVTQRKERERRLRREYDQTEKLLRTAPVAIAVQDADGDVVMANRHAQDVLGLSERELIDEPDAADEWELFDDQGDPLPPSETPSARVLRTGEPVYDEELAIEPPDGDRKQFRVNAAPIFDPDGEIERVVTTAEDITELKRQERQLERRKEELETELNEHLGRISDAFYALDDEWRFTHLNDSAVEILGRPREALLGREVWDVFPEAEGGVFWEEFRTAMETQDPASFEYFVEELDTWLEFSVYPSESGLSIYLRDITERKERERTLAKYETIVETVNDGIYVKDDDGRFTMVNDAYAELTGYDKTELVGAHASFVVDEATIERAKEKKEGEIDGDPGEPAMEADIETAEGDRVPTEGTFATIETADEDVEQVGVVRDISDRKEYERKIEESERRYRTLVDNFPDGVVALFDDDLRYVTAGGELMDEIGVRREEAIGTSIHDRYPDDLVAEIEPHFEAALDGEENSFEVEYHDRDLLAHTIPIDATGEDRTGMLVVQDVTERREYEHKLEASNERLEQFAYAASHDLQEPLRMVSSYLQLIERRYADDLDEDGREFIEFAVDGADRMRDMIDGLLEYSRVDTRGDPFEPVDLDEVFADVRDDFTVRIEESDADVEAEPLPRVRGDPGQLRQVFQNLLDNAIAYSGDDPPRIRVSAERAGDAWSISVHDEGVGIDPADADRVFEVFQRLDRSADHSGTGIGLSICERIVERHGGDIWVETDADDGTTFTFTLPAEGENRE